MTNYHDHCIEPKMPMKDVTSTAVSLEQINAKMDTIIENTTPEEPTS